MITSINGSKTLSETVITSIDGSKVDFEDFGRMIVTSNSELVVRALRTKVPKLPIGPVLVEA